MLPTERARAPKDAKCIRQVNRPRRLHEHAPTARERARAPRAGARDSGRRGAGSGAEGRGVGGRTAHAPSEGGRARRLHESGRRGAGSGAEGRA